MIEQCHFGSMVVDKTTYRSDLMIHPDGRVVDNWWRNSGHNLTMADLGELLAEEPQIIVIGTGIHGRMAVAPDVVKALADRGIESIAMHTEQAAEEFNRIYGKTKKVAGCFHLTC